MLFDLSEDGSKEILSRASKLIQDILADKPVKIFRGANTVFLQKILDDALDEDLDTEDFEKLMVLIEMHKPIVAENMARKDMMAQASAGIPVAEEQAPQTPFSPEAIPNTLGETQSMSQQASNMSPRYAGTPTA